VSATGEVEDQIDSLKRRSPVGPDADVADRNGLAAERLQ
jgi:hypothetical protein